ncbi:MAG: NADH-quinone oxidoreductase subunit C [Gammaproteobacteria bacterium RBG_16_57_12]|nr:MAG: NADH-quinone oxidoreductase subunit C [Gammaproteobacteria bacterium RBG_16_57_12]
MTDKTQALVAALTQRFGSSLLSCEDKFGEVTITVSSKHLHDICLSLRDEREFAFEQLIDLCGVDYLDYGVAEWQTVDATTTGFSRGREKIPANGHQGDRFAVVYHLLSISNNQRLRVRAYAAGDPPKVDSVTRIWNCANWYEREAFDLFGILFEGHQDLRRLLTDYGFIGHPFRKDFPLIGNVEMRYDAGKKRVVYEPVTIEPRVLVPRVIRDERVTEGEAGRG